MKKLFFIITVIAFSALNAQAQTTTFGLEAGGTDANLSIKVSGGSIPLTASSKIGFYAGAFADISVSDQFSVQPELFYSLLGSKLSVDYDNDNSSETEDLGYINLPVLLKYNKEGFSAFLGPQISYLLSAKLQVSGSNSENNKDQFNSTDLSGVIGVGYTLQAGLGFDARYQLGLSDISKNLDSEGTVKNSAFMIGIHYVFNYNK